MFALQGLENSQRVRLLCEFVSDLDLDRYNCFGLLLTMISKRSLGPQTEENLLDEYHVGKITRAKPIPVAAGAATPAVTAATPAVASGAGGVGVGAGSGGSVCSTPRFFTVLSCCTKGLT